MKLRTVIEHEFEVINVMPDLRENYVSILVNFKIKHSKGIKNNTITLENLIRTSPELKEYIKDLMLNQFNFEILEPSETVPDNIPGVFSISPRSNSKGIFYLSVYLNKKALENPEKAIDELLGGC